jgi:hypothetical protein
MIKLTTYAVVFMLLLYSCREEDSQNLVTVGDIGSNMNYVEINPPFTLELKFDSVKKQFTGSNSIDLDLDGSVDLIVSQRISLDSTIKYYNYDNFPYCWLTLKNGLEVATHKERYIIGHGDFDEVNWVDTLNVGDRVDKCPQWSDISVKIIWTMWAIAPIPYAVSHGCWYHLSTPEKYIGIRIKVGSGYRQGWIKVHQTSCDKMSIVSYAIEK